MKTKLTLLSILALLGAIFGAALKISPEIAAIEKFDFMEYLLRLLALPMTVGCLTVFLFVGISMTEAGASTLDRIFSIKDLSTIEVKNELRSWGIPSLLVLILSLSFSGYFLYKYAKSSYLFTRDKLVRQYEQEVWSKIVLEEQFRDWDLAAKRLASLDGKLSGVTRTDVAKLHTERIKELVADKALMTKEAARLEKTFGLNPRSTLLYASALSIHPWDEELTIKLRSILGKEFPKIVLHVVQTRNSCNKSQSISKVDAGRALIAIGAYHTYEIEVANPKANPGELLCNLISSWNDQKTTYYLTKIWLVTELSGIAEKLKVESLSQRKIATWESWTIKKEQNEESISGGRFANSTMDRDSELNFLSVPIFIKTQPSSRSSLVENLPKK